MKCYWINLEKDVERRQRFSEQLSLNNIENYRVKAIEHEKGYIGCCLSHIHMIYTAYNTLENDEDIVMFAEDDLNILHGIEHVNQYVKYLPKDWEILQLHYIEPTLIMQLIERANQNKLLYNKIMKGYFMSGACYLMNKKGMESFLNKMISINRADNLGSYTHKVTFDNPKCTPEEMLFRFINSYTLTIPLFNTHENYKSNLSEELEYMNRNYTNMCVINELHKLLNIKELDIDKDICILPYDLHFISFSKSSLVHNFVNRIYEDVKEYLIFLHSGLGNRLFQYCFTYALAKKNNAEFNVFYSTVNFQYNNSQYLNMFNISEDDNYPKIATYKLLDILIDPKQTVYTYHAIPINSCLYVKEKAEQRYTEYICDKHKTYIFDGCFQNEQYFSEYRDDILKMFREPPYVTKLLDELGSVYDNTVAIHVRLGDFVGFKKHFINLNEYYIHAMVYIQRRLQNVNFVIVSDEVNINTIYRVYPNLKGINKLITQNNDELVDLFFMTRCRGVICSNSTFSWWGAWLNSKSDKLITIPDKFLNDRDDIITMKGAQIISSYSLTV